jgi:excisionase family DNA binding protein
MERLALTISEACEVARASRTTLYRAIGRGELAARKRGRRTIVLVDDLRNWIENLPKLSVDAPRAARATSTTSRSTN